MSKSREYPAEQQPVDPVLMQWANDCLESLRDKAATMRESPLNFEEDQVVELAVAKLQSMIEHGPHNFVSREELLKHIDKKIFNFSKNLHHDERAEDFGHKPDEHVRFELQQQAWLRLRTELFPHYPELDTPRRE